MAANEPLIFPTQILVEADGPYVVSGNIPLVRKIQVVSEAGEPLAWKKQGEIETDSEYLLCRCGQSKEMPFCDGTHRQVDWDSTLRAPTSTFALRRVELITGSQMTIYFDASLCTDSGFCGNRNFLLLDGNTDVDNIDKRTLAIHMIEHCPSGALTYHLSGTQGEIEVDLPQQIGVTTEVVSEGPILGPLWVTGNIPILLSNGQPLEIRNRVTLCACGHSQSMPLCDGSHRDPRKQRCAEKE